MNARYVFLAALAASAAVAQVRVTAALNAAGYMRPGLHNGGLAQGAYIAIFGENIGPAGTFIANPPFQTTFQGVSARVGATDLFVVYTTPNQVGAIIPSSTPLGTLPLTVTRAGRPQRQLMSRLSAEPLVCLR